MSLSAENLVDEDDDEPINLQQLHASYQGKRFDFVDDILESSLTQRRPGRSSHQKTTSSGRSGDQAASSKPFIQSIDNKQAGVYTVPVSRGKAVGEEYQVVKRGREYRGRGEEYNV